MFGNSRTKAYILAALIAAAVPAWCMPLPVLAEDLSGQENWMRAAAEEVLREAEPIEREFRRRALDPEGASAIISSSGKALTREDGKWVTPGEQPESDQEISIVFVGDIIFETGQNPWSSIAYSDGIRACFDDATWDTLTGYFPLPAMDGAVAGRDGNRYSCSRQQSCLRLRRAGCNGYF